MNELQILKSACPDTMDIMEPFEQEMVLGGKIVVCNEDYAYDDETKEVSCSCGFIVSGQKPIFPADND